MSSKSGHVADPQPLAHLFTVSRAEVERRVTTGSKNPKPETAHRAKRAARP